MKQDKNFAAHVNAMLLSEVKDTTFFSNKSS